MSEIYIFGLVCTAIIAASILVAATVFILFIHAKAFIYDENCNPPWFISREFYIYNYDFGDAVFWIFTRLCIGVVAALVWPLSWLGAFVSGCLLASRKAIRFQKVYDGHKHDKKTGVVLQ